MAKMYYQTEFNIRPTQWATIASLIEGKSEKNLWHKSVQIGLTVEPYSGRTQGVIEWRTPELAAPEIRQAVLQGIKETAKEQGPNFPQMPIPLINFKVIITEYETHEPDIMPYMAERCAEEAFSNALKQADIILLNEAADTGYWEIADEQTKAVAEFQVLPTKTSTLAAAGETTAVFKRQSSGGRHQFAIIRLRLEPYQGVTDYWGGSDVLPIECPPEFIEAVFQGIQVVALIDNLQGGVLINIKATILAAQFHDLDSSSMSFKVVGGIGFKEIIAKTPIINLT